MSPDTVAQPAGGADLCGHTFQVLPRMSHRGAERPAAGHRLGPGDDPDLPDPGHGHPGGVEDQERRRKLLKDLGRRLRSLLLRVILLYENLPLSRYDLRTEGCYQMDYMLFFHLPKCTLQETVFGRSAFHYSKEFGNTIKTPSRQTTDNVAQQ